jgi:hypothetical protein
VKALCCRKDDGSKDACKAMRSFRSERISSSDNGRARRFGRSIDQISKGSDGNGH